MVLPASVQVRQLQAPSSKMEIVELLANRHGLSRYLELCTPTTGNYYGLLNRRVLTTSHRLLYRCPASFDDGYPIDFRSESSDIRRCVAEIRARGMRYDIILVDPFHEYDTSYRDLSDAFELVEASGFLVVHDCLPPNRDTAAPKYIDGEWCGVTYKAYLDFVCERRDLEYRTIDVDYGCGIIHKLGCRSWWAELFETMRTAGLATSSRRRSEQQQHSMLCRQWRALGDDFDRSFDFFDRHKRRLLKLIGPDEFLTSLQGVVSAPAV